MKDKIKWQAPTERVAPTNSLLDRVSKRPGEWAMVATVGPNDVPDWWGDVINNPDFEYHLQPQKADDPGSPRDVYIRRKAHGHDHEH